MKIIVISRRRFDCTEFNDFRIFYLLIKFWRLSVFELDFLTRDYIFLLLLDLHYICCIEFYCLIILGWNYYQ